MLLVTYVNYVPFSSIVSACFCIVRLLSSGGSILLSLNHVTYNMPLILILGLYISYQLDIAFTRKFPFLLNNRENTSFKLGRVFIMQIWDFRFEKCSTNPFKKQRILLNCLCFLTMMYMLQMQENKNMVAVDCACQIHPKEPWVHWSKTLLCNLHAWWN